MNERIRELWSQAGGHYNSGNQHTWPEYTIDDPKKFAELIVQECIDIIAPYTVRMSRPGEEYLHPIQEIKKNFGDE